MTTPQPYAIWRPHSWSLGTQLACGAAALAIIATVVLSVVIGAATLDRLREEAGAASLATALQMGETLSRGMFERYRDIQVVASLDVMTDGSVPAAEKRRLLDRMQSSFRDYAWIGIADPAGSVLASTGGILEGADASQRPWFVDGRHSTTVKDVHEAVLLAKLLPADPSGEPLRFVDVATPLRDADDRVLGVLGAHLSWRWATQVSEALLRTRSGGEALEILVLSADGTVLLGPAALTGAQLSMPSVRAAIDGLQGHDIETWPDDDRPYLTAYARSPGYGDYPGLGWLVLVREPVEIAFASARQLQSYIILIGGAATLALVAGGWFAARRVARPVLAIAEAADRIARAEHAQAERALQTHGAGNRYNTFPLVEGSREFSILARSLRQLMDSLLKRETELIDLNLSLEVRVTERTESLTAANEKLEREIALRGALEAEREQLIADLRNQAETDTLTGLYNRRGFMNLAQRDFRRTQRQNSAAAVIMLDIDHFKHVNDTHGHPAGDAVIRAVARALRENLREVDIVARIGGEEFAVMLTDCDPHRVEELAERLRAAVARLKIDWEGTVLQVTASVGTALATDATLLATHLDTLIARADKALYAAKNSGRNRVVADNTAAALS